MRFSLKTQTGLAMALLLATTGIASAQLDEIVVTAERRVANLQDVPVAVTAISAEDIERAGIHDPHTLQFKVPNFSFSAFSPGQNVFSLRGVSSNEDGAGTENSIAVFMDDVYFGRISNSAFDFFDVEQVEVLRGPQGTLWGKNAIGGTINITTTKPSLEKWSSRVRLDAGDYNTQNFGGVVTGPLTSNLALKVSYNSRNRDGFVYNVLDRVSVSPEERHLDENSTNYRAQFLWELSDSTSATLTVGRQNTDNNDIARMPIPNQNPALSGPTQGPATYQAFLAAGGSVENLISVNPINGFSRSDADTQSLKIVHDLANGGELTYIFADYETTADWEMDSVGAPTLALTDDIYDVTEAQSHELRYATDLSDKLSMVAGVFYLNEDTDRTEYFRIIVGDDDRNPVPGAPVADDLVDGYRQINETESTAVFAHFDWQFRPNLGLSVGARWTEDEKEIVSFAQNGLSGFIINGDIGNVATATGGVRDSGSWDNVSPKVSVNWTPKDDLLIYASWAEGFKSGGFGAAPATPEQAQDLNLDQEEAENIEIGVKGEFLNNRLRVNAAVFQTDYENLQFQRFGPLLIESPGGTAIPGVENVAIDPNSFGQFRSVNSGNAEIDGLEFEFAYAPNDNLTINGSYGYLDTEQVLNFRPYFTDPSGSPVLITRPLNRAPENQYALGFVYERPVAQGLMVATLDYSYSDEMRADALDEYSVEDERELIDASISYGREDAGWRITAWGKNITDERYFQHVYTIGRGVIGTIGDPRVLGLSLSMEY